MPTHTGNEPTDLPVVESCVRQVKSKGQSKESAIKICVERLRQAGRIEKRGDKWVQKKPKEERRERARS